MDLSVSFAIAVILGLIAAVIARLKGRSLYLWWLYGAAIPPVAILHALLLKPTIEMKEHELLSQGGKKCPYCAEVIKAEAIICRYCGKDIPELAIPTQTEPVIEVSAAAKYLNSIKDEDKVTYEIYNQQTEKERKSVCFACHGEDSACGMCDFRESNLKKYLEAKQTVEATGMCQ